MNPSRKGQESANEVRAMRNWLREMRRWRWYSKVLFVLVVAAFAYWVWPTPYRYLPVPGENLIGRAWLAVGLRVNRFTGDIQACWSGPGRAARGWHAFAALPKGEGLSEEAESEIRALHRRHWWWSERTFRAWLREHHPCWDEYAALYFWIGAPRVTVRRSDSW
jgi:hypothetical protein